MITGYRRFQLEYNDQLDSWLLRGAHSTEWEGRELQAECNGLKELCEKHLLEDDCSCGIYLLKQPDLDLSYKTYPVLAAVSGWGAYIEWTKGWQVQFTRIEHLWLEEVRVHDSHSIQKMVDSLTKRYGVGVELRAKPKPAHVVEKIRHSSGRIVYGATGSMGRTYATTFSMSPTGQAICAACNTQHEMAYWPAATGPVSICQMATDHIVNAMRYLKRPGRGAVEAKWERAFEIELKRREPQRVNGRMTVRF